MAPGLNQTVAVASDCSDLLIVVFGPENGSHVRSAVRFAELPANVPVELETEVEIDWRPARRYACTIPARLVPDRWRGSSTDV